MLDADLRALRARCDAARAQRPFPGGVLIRGELLHELLVVFEAAAAVGKDSTDERFDRLMDVIPT